MQLRDVLAEWEECEDAHLEMLQSERYSDDGDAERQTDYRVVQTDEEAS